MAQFNLSLNQDELHHLIMILEMTDFNNPEDHTDEWNVFLTKLGTKMVKKFRSSGYTSSSVNSLENRIKEINQK